MKINRVDAENLGSLVEEELDAGIRQIIRSQLLPRSKAHIPVLERLSEIA
jgi:hypothetical protein